MAGRIAAAKPDKHTLQRPVNNSTKLVLSDDDDDDDAVPLRSTKTRLALSRRAPSLSDASDDDNDSTAS